jgi:hypothetical protein
MADLPRGQWLEHEHDAGGAPGKERSGELTKAMARHRGGGGRLARWRSTTEEAAGCPYVGPVSSAGPHSRSR